MNTDAEKLELALSLAGITENQLYNDISNSIPDIINILHSILSNQNVIISSLNNNESRMAVCNLAVSLYLSTKIAANNLIIEDFINRYATPFLSVP
jgi:hypothetical protein